jgi:hypothetical protein
MVWDVDVAVAALILGRTRCYDMLGFDWLGFERGRAVPIVVSIIVLMRRASCSRNTN